MIMSLDGATALDGVSGGLGSPADQAVFSTLRARSDLIIVGAGTARAEGYRPVRRPGQRLAIVTASGRMPFGVADVETHPQTVIVTTEDGPDFPEGVQVRRYGRGQVDLKAAVGDLGDQHVQLEGGSSLNGQFFALGLVDEICLTISPRVVGGLSGRVASNPREHLQAFDLVHVLESDGLLFCRYRRTEPAD